MMGPGDEYIHVWGTLRNLFMQRECQIRTLRGDEGAGRGEDSQQFLCSWGKKEYLWVILLNLEMNNKETELICNRKGHQIIPVEQIELEYKC